MQDFCRFDNEPDFHIPIRNKKIGPEKGPRDSYPALLARLPAVFTAESLDSPGGINQFLLSSEKRMAAGAYFDMDIL
jgi:hypothetical protein